MATPLKQLKAKDTLEFANKPTLLGISGKLVVKTLAETIRFASTFNIETVASDITEGSSSHDGKSESGGGFSTVEQFVDRLSDLYLDVTVKGQTIAQANSFSAQSQLKVYVMDGEDLVEIDFVKSATKLIAFLNNITNYDFDVAKTLQNILDAVNAPVETVAAAEETKPIKEVPVAVAPTPEEESEAIDLDADIEMNDDEYDMDDNDDEGPDVVAGLITIVSQAKGDVTITTGDGDEDYHTLTFDPEEEAVFITHGDGTEQTTDYSDAISSIVEAAEEDLSNVSVSFPFKVSALGTTKTFKSASKRKKDRQAETAKLVNFLKLTLADGVVIRNILKPNPSLEDLRELSGNYMRSLRARLDNPQSSAMVDVELIGTIVSGGNTVVFNGEDACVFNKAGDRVTTLADALSTIDFEEAVFQVDPRILQNREQLSKELGIKNLNTQLQGVLLTIGGEQTYATIGDTIQEKIKDCVLDISQSNLEELKEVDMFFEENVVQPISELVAEHATDDDAEED
ncbi:hypothetical protein GR7B_00055 [Vibrio phage vB_VcorM_GR7B]|nr:hypothetical protein GR7B_00055 [Vibrio phage vB_VcorM_GR7B]